MAGFLTKKMAGAPTYVWIFGGVVLIGGVVYYEKKKKAAAAAPSSAAATAAGAATTGAATTPYGPSGGGGIDPGTLAAILASQGAGATTSTTASTSGVQGSWGGQSWTFQPIAAGATLPSGVQLFYQPVPGVFDTYTSGVPAGTQLYTLPNSTQPTGLQQGNAGGGPPTTVP